MAAQIEALNSQRNTAVLHLVGVPVVQRRRCESCPCALDVDGEILPGLPALWWIGDQPGVAHWWNAQGLYPRGLGLDQVAEHFPFANLTDSSEDEVNQRHSLERPMHVRSA